MASTTHAIPTRILIGIFAIAYATLQFEVLSSRVLSAFVLRHYAYVVIALAMLGWTVGGLRASRAAPSDGATCARSLMRGALALAFAIIGTTSVYVFLARADANFIRDFGDFSTSVSIGILLLTLLVGTVAVAVPFSFGGYIIARATAYYAARAGTLYAVDLAGAALGAIGAVILLPPLGAIGALTVTALAALVGVLAFSDGHAATRRTIVLAAIGIVGLAVVDHVILVRSRAPSVEYTGWNAISYLTVHRQERTVTTADGAISWRRGDDPYADLERIITIDRDAATPLIPVSGDVTDVPQSAHAITAAPYAVRRGEVLVIGSGGGADVLAALQFPDNQITAVEVNPGIAHLAQDRYATFTGHLFTHPRVALIVAEARAFLRNTPRTFDVVVSSLVDTWASSATGATATVENYLYTTEAFREYLAHLRDGGVLVFTRWNGEGDAMAALIASALGTDRLTSDVRVLHHQNLVSFLIKRGAWSTEENAMLQSFADANHYTLIGVVPPLATTVQRASTDDRPFFFQRLAPIEWWSIRKNTTAASRALVATFWIICTSALALTVHMLRKRPRAPARTIAIPIAYALLIGIAFFLAEVALIQRLVLFVGNPMLTFAVLLAGFLGAAGIGSRIADRLPLRTASTMVLLGAPILLLTTELIAIPALLRVTIASEWIRATLSLAVLAPCAVAMGMCFPFGVRWVRTHTALMVESFWVVNSSGSVVGSIGALLASLEFGFRGTLLLASVLYLTAVTLLISSFARSGATFRAPVAPVP